MASIRAEYLLKHLSAISYSNSYSEFRLFKLFLTLLIILQTPFALGVEITDLSIGVGSMTEYVGKVQLDASGKTNSFEFNPTLLGSMEVTIWENYKFYPEAGFILPHSSEDEDITRFTYFVLGNLGYALKDFRFLLGVGWIFTRISSKGGQKALNNGNSIDYFYLPEQSSTSYNLVQTAGVEYFLYKQDISMKAQGAVYNLTDSTKRAYSYLVTMHYHFDPLENYW